MTARTRQEALTLGSSRYFTSTPCANGHIAERRTKNTQCIGCKHAAKRTPKAMAANRLSAKRWNREHPTETAIRISKWRAENPDRVKVIRQRYVQKNVETLRLKNRVRRRERPPRPEDRSAWEANRRAALRRATPQWVDRQALKEFYRARPKGMHVDHIVPLTNTAVCGLHVAWNLQYLTPSENSQKKNRLLSIVRERAS